MKIEINESEIHDAIVAHVETMGINLSGKDLKVKLTAGRTVNGSTAEITITPKVLGNSAANVTSIGDGAKSNSNEGDLKPEKESDEKTPDGESEKDELLDGQDDGGAEKDDSIFQQ